MAYYRYNCTEMAKVHKRHDKTGAAEPPRKGKSILQHLVEQFHVASGGDIPAEVLRHLVLLQGTEAFMVIVVQIQAALDGGQEIVTVA